MAGIDFGRRVTTNENSQKVETVILMTGRCRDWREQNKRRWEIGDVSQVSRFHVESFRLDLMTAQRGYEKHNGPCPSLHYGQIRGWNRDNNWIAPTLAKHVWERREITKENRNTLLHVLPICHAMSKGFLRLCTKVVSVLRPPLSSPL